MLRVGLVGASGYSGSELLRLLLQHPSCGEVTLFSAVLQSAYKNSHDGHISLSLNNLKNGRHYKNYMHPAFYGLDLKIYGPPTDNSPLAEWGVFYRSFDVIFLATPAAVSVRMVRRYMELSGSGLAKIIDLSGALRLCEPQLYLQWYREETLSRAALKHCKYGLSEIFDIAAAQIVANPGCYATAAILALAPLARSGLLGRVRIDAKSGVSGAGKKATDSNHFPRVNESLSLYKLHQHQHIPEIEMALSRCLSANSPGDSSVPAVAPITFASHLLPITRGLMATCYVELLDNNAALHDLYQTFYAAAPFVQIRPEEGDLRLPQIQDVIFSNRCDIGLHCNPRNKELVVVAVLDNLLKGAAGQALQNMNLLFGLQQQLGLSIVGALP